MFGGSGGLGISDEWMDDWESEQQADDGGDSDTSSPVGERETFRGLTRDMWHYTGDNRAVFEQWQAGEISTDTFQSETGPGEGTAALSRTEPSQTDQQTPSGGLPVGMLALGGVIAIILIMEVSN